MLKTTTKESDEFQSLSIGGKLLESGFVTDGESERVSISGLLLDSDTANLYLSAGQTLDSDYGDAALLEPAMVAIDGQSGTGDTPAAPESGQVAVIVGDAEPNQEKVVIIDERTGSHLPVAEYVAEVPGEQSQAALQTSTDEQVETQEEAPAAALGKAAPDAPTKSENPGAKDVGYPEDHIDRFSPEDPNRLLHGVCLREPVGNCSGQRREPSAKADQLRISDEHGLARHSEPLGDTRADHPAHQRGKS